MPQTHVPSGHGYVEIPLTGSERKSLKSVQVHQDCEALNVDLEFEDDSMLEMSFQTGFAASVKLLDYKDGNYLLRRRLRPKKAASLS